MEPLRLWTVGHSTRSLEAFLELLKSADIRTVADVRRFPASRRMPHFNEHPLAESLAAAGIEYAPFPELGGRRRARPDSPNTAWRHEAFRGYADFMMTAEFHAGLERLRELARRKRTAILCAEALWWKCHRGLIADALKAGGDEVLHLVSPGKTEPHPFTSAARIVDGRLSYRAPETATLFPS